MKCGPLVHGCAGSERYGVFEGEAVGWERGDCNSTGEEAFAKGGTGKEGGEREEGEGFWGENDEKVAAIAAYGIAKHLWVGVGKYPDVGDGEVHGVGCGCRESGRCTRAVDTGSCVLWVKDARLEMPWH